MKNILIAGGSGFIGKGLVNYFFQQRAAIAILGRDIAKIKKIFGHTVTALDWNSFEKNSTEILRKTDAIINLCGENIGDKRWSQQRKQLLFDSRIQPTQILANACAILGDKSPHLLNASGCGIYGIQANQSFLPPAFEEKSPLQPSPNVFISKLACAWEYAAYPAIDAEVKVTNMRFGVVLAKQGGALAKLAPLFRWYLGGRIGSGTQPFSWISLIDLCRAIDFIIQHPDQLTGPVNLVAPQCITQIEFAHAFAQALHRPALFKTPTSLLRLRYGQMAEELLLAGQHVIPARLLEQNFVFNLPDIVHTLNSVYQPISE